jgi:hypothetical protein
MIVECDLDKEYFEFKIMIYRTALMKVIDFIDLTASNLYMKMLSKA